MNNQIETVNRPHALKRFDGELEQLKQLALGMKRLLVTQLEQALQALEDGDAEMALKVVNRSLHVHQYHREIDAEVLELLARQAPVAGDLRTVISTSKIAVELNNIGNEIERFARLVAVLYDPATSDPNPRLLENIVKLARLVMTMLINLMVAVEHGDASHMHELFYYEDQCESEFQAGVKHQLDFVLRDVRLTSRSLDIMRMMKCLERSGEHCKNIAEYVVYMMDGIDVRHPASSRDF